MPTPGTREEAVRVTPDDGGAEVSTGRPPAVVPEWFGRWGRATLHWGLVLLVTALVLAAPTPGVGHVLWFFVAMGADGAGLDPSTEQIWATVVVDVVTFEVVTVALVAAVWVGAGEPVPAGTTAVATWAARWRTVAMAWLPPLPVLMIATAVGGAAWASLGLLTVCLVVLTAGVCGLAVGVRALLARAGAARLATMVTLGAMVVTGIVGAFGPGPSGRPVTALVVVSPYTAVADAMARTTTVSLWSAAGGMANAGRGPSPSIAVPPLASRSSSNGKTSPSPSIAVPPPGFPLWSASLAVTGAWGCPSVVCRAAAGSLWVGRGWSRTPPGIMACRARR